MTPIASSIACAVLYPPSARCWPTQRMEDERGRDAHAAERIIHRGDFSQHAAAMGKIGMIHARDERDAMRRQVLVVEGPPPFHVHQRLARAVAAGEIPGILGIDAIGRRVEVTLVGEAGIIRGVHQRRLDRGRLDIGDGDRIPLRQRPYNLFSVRARRNIHREIGAEVGGAEGRIQRAGPFGKRRHLLRLDGEEGFQRDPLELRRQLTPGTSPLPLQRPRRILARQPDMILELDHHPAAEARARPRLFSPWRTGILAFNTCHHRSPC